ncbi:MAG: hypothetical protein MR717_09210 [Prevotella sp.]|nr:hypothetical protein [Prevotella sp.]
MEYYYFLKSENGYVVIDGKLTAVKLLSVTTHNDKAYVSYRYNLTVDKLPSHHFFASKEMFERGEPITLGKQSIDCMLPNFTNNNDGTFTGYTIDKNRMPKEIIIRTDKIICPFKEKAQVYDAPSDLYATIAEAFQNTTYTEVGPDGEEKTNVGLVQLLKLTEEQLVAIDTLRLALNSLKDHGVTLVSDTGNSWYAVNTKKVSGFRVTSERDEPDDRKAKDGEEDVRNIGKLRIMLGIKAPYCEDGLAFHVRR